MSRSHLHVIEPVVAIAKNWANTGNAQLLSACIVIFLKHVILEEKNLRKIL